MKRFIVRKTNGSFVMASGRETAFAAHAAFYDAERDALHAALRFVGAKIVPVEAYSSLPEYKSEETRSLPHFVSNICGTILLVCLLTLPVFAQSVSKPAAAPPMPCYSSNFTATIAEPVEIAHCEEAASITTAAFLKPVPEPPIVLTPMKSEPIKAQQFSVPLRLLRVGGKAAGKVDGAVEKAEYKNIEDHKHYADGKNVKQKNRLVWGRP